MILRRLRVTHLPLLPEIPIAQDPGNEHQKPSNRSGDATVDNQPIVLLNSAILDKSTANRRPDKDGHGTDVQGAETGAELLFRRDLGNSRRRDADEDSGAEPVEAREGDDCCGVSSWQPHGQADYSGQRGHRVQQVEAADVVGGISATVVRLSADVISRTCRVKDLPETAKEA